MSRDLSSLDPLITDAVVVRYAVSHPTKGFLVHIKLGRTRTGEKVIIEINWGAAAHAVTFSQIEAHEIAFQIGGMVQKMEVHEVNQ